MRPEFQEDPRDSAGDPPSSLGSQDPTGPLHIPPWVFPMLIVRPSLGLLLFPPKFSLPGLLRTTGFDY